MSAHENGGRGGSTVGEFDRVHTSPTSRPWSEKPCLTCNSSEHGWRACTEQCRHCGTHEHQRRACEGPQLELYIHDCVRDPLSREHDLERDLVEERLSRKEGEQTLSETAGIEQELEKITILIAKVIGDHMETLRRVPEEIDRAFDEGWAAGLRHAQLETQAELDRLNAKKAEVEAELAQVKATAVQFKATAEKMAVERDRLKFELLASWEKTRLAGLR